MFHLTNDTVFLDRAVSGGYLITVEELAKFCVSAR